MPSDRGDRFGTALDRSPRGRAAPTDTIVGVTMIESMLMTPGAQANELTRIDNDMRSFATEIAAAAHAHGDTVPPLATAADFAEFVKAIAAQPASTTSDPVVNLFRTGWLPLWQTWQAFYQANHDGAWFSNPVSEGEKYQEQLIDLRGRIGALGVKLNTPGPKQEHPEGLPSWLVPVGVGVGAIAVLSMLTRGNG